MVLVMIPVAPEVLPTNKVAIIGEQKVSGPETHTMDNQRLNVRA